MATAASLEVLSLKNELNLVYKWFLRPTSRFENLRLLELLLSCDGVGEVDADFSDAVFNCDLLLAFNCSCCSVCKFLLVNCIAAGTIAVCMLFAGDAPRLIDWLIKMGFKEANFDAAWGFERVMHT